MDRAARLLAPLAWAVPVLVVVQALLIGQALTGSPELVGLHGVLGNVTFVLAALAVLIAWLVPASRAVRLLLTLSAVLLVAQTGLGYIGHRSGVGLATSVHVGLGVALTVVATLAATLTMTRPHRA
jgi:heme A synthase